MDAVLGLEDLARPGEDLARDEERNQLLRQVVEVDITIYEVVLVTAIAVAHEVGVVLEDRELAGDAFFANLLLGIDLEIFEDSLSGLVVDDELAGRCTLRGRVFGMTTRILVETRPILEKDVEEVFGGDQLLEEKADGLLDRQSLPALGREDSAR